MLLCISKNLILLFPTFCAISQNGGQSSDFTSVIGLNIGRSSIMRTSSIEPNHILPNTEC